MAEPVSPLVVSAMAALYAAEPDEFMAERKRLAGEARAAGDKAAATEIGRLRKPSLAAWAVNLVAREAPTELAAVLGVGEHLREAQTRLDMATVQSLRPDRDRAVDGFVTAAGQALADRGRELRGAAEGEVRDSAIAALADAGAAKAVASGQLVKALSYSGFGEVDISDAVARTSSGAVLTVVEGSGGSTSAGAPSSAAAEAVARTEQAAEAGQAAGREAAARAERLDQARAELAAAEQAVADAEVAMTEARRGLRAARRARDAAAAAVAEAATEAR